MLAAAAATKALLRQAVGNSLDEQATVERRAQLDRLRVLEGVTVAPQV